MRPAYRECGNCDHQCPYDFRDSLGELDGEYGVCHEIDAVVDLEGPGCEFWEWGDCE